MVLVEPPFSRDKACEPPDQVALSQEKSGDRDSGAGSPFDLMGQLVSQGMSQHRCRTVALAIALLPDCDSDLTPLDVICLLRHG